MGDQLQSRDQSLAQPGSLSAETRIGISQALLEDANGWAQHFSLVRMVVATAIGGLCVVIMTVRWERPEPMVVWSTLGTWLTGAALFVVFSLEEWRKLDQRRRNLRMLRTIERGGQLDLSESVRRPSAVARLTNEWLRQRDWAYGAYFVFTAMFLAAWTLWWYRMFHSA